MDAELQKQLIKQLKMLNFWVRFFGILVLLTILVIGYLLFRTVMLVRQTSENLRDIRQSTSERLDVKQQVCEGDGTFSDFIRSKTDACK